MEQSPIRQLEQQSKLPSHKQSQSPQHQVLEGKCSLTKPVQVDVIDVGAFSSTADTGDILLFRGSSLATKV